MTSRYDCDSEGQAVSVHCEECQVNMCEHCAAKHRAAKRTRQHTLTPSEEKKLSTLKTEGWKVSILSGLGMDDDATVQNLSKSFADVTVAGCSGLAALRDRAKRCRGQM